ncbi:MAG: ATPase, T2SS/T4P/T4SS family [Candidatus Gygaella obscura]|nr:ATPase, T2SS/T4P/T4SS family [Candidatus Gygaella obscura]
MSLLTDSLIKEGLITKEQFEDAKIKQKGAQKPIQDLLIDMGFVNEDDLLKISSRMFNQPVVDLEKEKLDVNVLKLIPYELAKRYGVFALRKDSDHVLIATSDVQNVVVLDDIRAITKQNLKAILCKKSQVNEFIEKSYNFDDSLYDILKNFKDDVKIELIKDENEELVSVNRHEKQNHTSPTVKLTSLIINDAVKKRASDIHIEAQEKISKVRYRIDGDLRNIMDVPGSVHPALISRIKVLSGLDITETRKPQDGRAKISLNGKRIDLRISTIPTFHGEKLEIRVLDPEEAKIELSRIGFDENEIKLYKEAIASPQGIILITGPTGSGKTSTLYATLNSIKAENKNIVTIEDPIEYLIEGVNQMQVNPAKDVTFANGLRSLLRQDPNVILVGEIRDKDTAEIAFRSSLTGHLVFSTLHTNNAVSSITRLFDIGLEAYLVASSLILVVAQRLVKLICPECKEEYKPNGKLLEDFKKYIDNLKIDKFYRAKGCKKCGYSGYFGRTAAFEILKINDKLKDLITAKSPEHVILNEAQNAGSNSLTLSAMKKVKEGIVCIEDVAKIIGVAEKDKVIQKSVETGEKLKILVSDDEEDLLMLVKKRLEAAGYYIILSRDGEELVELAYNKKPDLIITDVTMPKLNGYEAINALKTSLETASIPIIMLTARQDKDSEIKGIDVGADDYITKPFDKDKLLARIKMLLRRKK